MSSMSLYNKWRPRTFADPADLPIVGQEHVTRTLRNAIASGQIAHAYLFSGPRGTGKTSAARILARAVNCRRGLSGEPCNQCENCQALLQGRQLDLLIEIDGASNRGVDDVRQLRERLMQRPGGADLTGRYKVYIVDEVHMLTTEAFNALLKSLEEPPGHVIFVLATTDPQKVPATVASRCQRFDFKPIPLETLVRHLTHVAESEGVRLEPAAVELLARTAAGGARDAISLLDQALAFAGMSGDVEGGATGATITGAHVQAMLGLTDFEAVCQLVDALAERDLPGGLRLIHRVVSQGGDLRQFCRQVLELLRALMLVCSDAAALVKLDDDTMDAVRLRAQRFTLREIIHLIKLFGQAEQGLKSPSAQPQLPLELAVVEALVAPTVSPPMDTTPRTTVATAAAPAHVPALEAAGEPLAAEAFTPAQQQTAGRTGGSPDGDGEVGRRRASELAQPHPATGPEAAPEALPAERDQPVLDKQKPVVQTPALAAGVPPPVKAPRTTLTVRQVEQQWQTVLRSLRQSGRTRFLEALLQDGRVVAIEAGNVIVLEFAYPFHANKVLEVANQIAISKVFSHVLGVQCKVRSVVAERMHGATERAQPVLGRDDPVVAKALRIWHGHILSGPELAAIEALPELPVVPSSASDL